MDNLVENVERMDELKMAQSDRTERAKAALLTGQFQVSRVAPGQWTVKNGDKLPYTVTLAEDNWTCTCLDYQQRGPMLNCKHIEGVRLSEAAQSLINLSIHKEIPMEQPQISLESGLQGQFDHPIDEDHLLWELRQPLDMSRVKRRQAPGLGSVPFLEGHDVIERANAIFGFAWSFELVGEPVVLRWQKKVLIWNEKQKRKVPLIDDNGNFQTEEIGIVYVAGKVLVDLGGKQYCHADLGRCIFSGDTPEALDMALAGSATDCLKRCFRQLGEQFGNSLYDKEIAQNAGLDMNRDLNRPTGAPASPRPQSTQFPASAPGRSRHSTRKYADGTHVNGNVSEQEAFDRYQQQYNLPPASKTDLRAWLANQTPAETSAPASKDN